MSKVLANNYATFITLNTEGRKFSCLIFQFFFCDVRTACYKNWSIYPLNSFTKKLASPGVCCSIVFCLFSALRSGPLVYTQYSRRLLALSMCLLLVQLSYRTYVLTLFFLAYFSFSVEKNHATPTLWARSKEQCFLLSVQCTLREHRPHSKGLVNIVEQIEQNTGN